MVDPAIQTSVTELVLPSWRRSWSPLGASVLLAGLMGVGAAIWALVGSLGHASAGAAVGLLVALVVWWAQTRLAVRADTVVLIGGGPVAVVLASALAADGPRPVSLRRPRPLRVRRAATFAEAAEQVRATRCDDVVLAGSIGLRWSRLVDARDREVRLVAGVALIERLLGRVPLDIAREDPWLRALGSVRAGSAYAWVKRALDVVGVLLIGLAVVPLLPLVALAIRLDSPGPVFYAQTRVGLGGRPFRIHKFRTMRSDAERDGAVWAQPGDRRVTRVGRFLRRVRLDELPQLWDVLRGEMSLVGPRPERPEFTALLEREMPDYAKRHAVKPGLTGWAQVRHSYTRSVQETRTKLEFDLYYVKHVSLALDLRILLRTILVVLRMQGC